MVVKFLLSVQPGVLHLQCSARQVGTLFKESEKASAYVLSNYYEFQRRRFLKTLNVRSDTSVLAVKRPLNSYFLYLKDNRAKMKAHLGMTAERGELYRRIGKEWNGLNPQQKQIYQSKAQLLAKEFEQKLITADKLRQKLESFAKQPLSSYHLFLQNNLAKVPGRSVVDRVPKLAVQWKELGTMEKSKYKNTAGQLADAHKANLKQLSEKEIQALGELKVEKRLAKLKRLGRKTRIQQKAELALKFKRPRKPVSAFLLYISNLNSQLEGTGVQKAKIAAQRWDQLSDIQKKSFLDRARVALENHKKDLAAWEKEMIAKGRKDVVAKFHTRNDLKFLPEGTRIPGTKHRRPAKKAGLKKKTSTLRKKVTKGVKKSTPKVGKKAKKILSGLVKKAKVTTKKAAKKIGIATRDVKKIVAKTAEKVVKKATIAKK